MPESPHNAKQRIRRAVRADRAAFSAPELLAQREALAVQLRELVQQRGAHLVTCYLPSAGEPDPSGFLQWAHEHDVTVLLPITRRDGLLNWAHHVPGATAPGLFGIAEPTGEQLPPEAAAGADLMLIPACAVDRRGTRLGWGRGYFDRVLALLPESPPVYALVHDSELRTEVPREAHDAPVDGVVTPSRTVHFSHEPRVHTA